MAVINACLLPDDLYYDVEKSVWVRPEGDGLLVTGFSDPFQTRCGKLLVLRPRGVGRPIPAGKALATVESAKWVGAFPMVVSGVVVACNEAVVKTPSLVNKDPYGEGWVARVRPDDPAGALTGLLTGEAAVAAFAEKLKRDKVTCMRCVE